MKQYLFLLISVYLFLSYLTVHASVILNEVAIQPNQVVEIYNSASESADISNWYIDDSGGTTYYTIPAQTILPPQSCLIFSSDFNFNKSSSDTVRLFDNTSPPISSSAKLREQYSYTKAPDTNYSFSKKTDGGTEWQTIVASLGLYNESLSSCIPIPTSTPSPTEIPTPISTSTPIPYSPTPHPSLTLTPTSLPDYQNIYISEVYPYPQSNEGEWIELYNGNDIQVNLEHWYIDDGESTGSTPKSFSLLLDPHTYSTVDLSSSLFNNSGDVVRILDSNKNEKDSMEYGKISQGKSIARISFSEDSYCEQESSKNTNNLSCIGEQTRAVSSQTVNKIITSIPKITLSTKKNTNQQTQQISRINTNTSSINTLSISTSKQEGVVLGAQEKKSPHTSFIPYFSSVSFSYSLLTIVSIFIKMKNA